MRLAITSTPIEQPEEWQVKRCRLSVKCPMSNDERLVQECFACEMFEWLVEADGEVECRYDRVYGDSKI